jgi:hypothetical protein
MTEHVEWLRPLVGVLIRIILLMRSWYYKFKDLEMCVLFNSLIIVFVWLPTVHKIACTRLLIMAFVTVKNENYLNED